MLEHKYIITNGNDFGRIKITPEDVIKLLPYWSYVSVDIEAGGLDMYDDVLLIGLYNEGTSIVIMPDVMESPRVKRLIQELSKVLIIAHNAKYDLTLLKVSFGLDASKVWCTEIAERRLYQGLGVSKKYRNGIRFNLNDTIDHHVKEVKRTSKDIRNDFIGETRKTYKPKPIHIQYLDDDIQYLHKIKNSQFTKLNQVNKLNFIQEVAMPLVCVLRDMEIDGFDLNVDKWKQNIEDSKNNRFDSEIKLDKLRDNLIDKYAGQHKVYVTGGIYSRDRKKPTEVFNTDLFGAQVVVVDDTSKKYFNYNSDTQIKYLFAILKLPLPSSEGYRIPVFLNKKLTEVSVAYTKRQQLIDNYPTNEDELTELCVNGIGRALGSVSVGIPALNEMLKAMPEHPAKDFLKELQVFSMYNTRVTNYGQNYIDKIHPVTGKLHTIYRQCNALNGRLQSGGGKKQSDKYNSQNIPRANEYRTCFYYKDNYIITADLSGAEVTIMADKAKDASLKRMAIEEDDIHSPIAQACWRAIYLYRAGVRMSFWNDADTFETYRNSISFDKVKTDDKVKELVRLSKEYQITKTINKDKRGDFKSITFGSVYGAFPKKIASTLNVTVEEGKIVLNTIKSMIPQTFVMVETILTEVFGVNSYSYQQKGSGVAIFNSRSCNSVLIPPVIEQKKYDVEPDWRDLNDWKSAVRNLTISGTQADMLKEAMVTLWKFIRKNNINANILIQVHDELAVRCHKDIIDSKQRYSYNGKLLEFPDIVANIMTDTANLYLDYLKMNVDYVIEETWIK
jgi:DNA polymerase I-like protein with 3'-5' exonuclease and polymerase domains